MRWFARLKASQSLPSKTGDGKTCGLYRAGKLWDKVGSKWYCRQHKANWEKYYPDIPFPAGLWREIRAVEASLCFSVCVALAASGVRHKEACSFGRLQEVKVAVCGTSG
eukprot:s6797_g1.t1